MFELSPREQTVLELMAQGLSNKEITQKLRVQLTTVRTHIIHVYQKLGLIGEAPSAVRVKAVLMYLNELNKGN